MKGHLKESIAIPGGVEVSIEGDLIKLKGVNGKAERRLINPNMSLVKEKDMIIIECNKSTRREKMLINTFAAHLKNLIKGVVEGFKYKLKICSSHFPMSVSVRGEEVIIKNFFGEKNPRTARIVKGVKVTINGEEIILEGCNVEDVGQTASNIELATRRTKFDRRIFQDGIYITHKAGIEI